MKLMASEILNNIAILSPKRQESLSYFNVCFFFGNQSLNQANLIKFLGLHVDEHLTWKHHISFICKQL